SPGRSESVEEETMIDLSKSARYAAAVLLAGFAAPQLVHAQWSWHAALGAQSNDREHQALAFLPNELWIHAGDTVTCRSAVDEIHTVTFLRTDPSAQVRPSFPAGCPGFRSSPGTF